mmetsp:Transcript_4487/g.13612  ORF Transcript_4487/g.13612 Transcript_4487/m.13612 type:complete len:280 (+) Transcript_4487:296-1135(+)|eukprot:CAMPEP_0198731688 /NCGR_PEP_ID=MMETSP1475-20131203/31458_1 /TAXON_ID= ORGANISM="Unidentified sp., Strain CCMP1999" /NCGR_SAMPLE_ID=MMETSP1475 /ASSEMBLY_ACC=CAM_ASM_001111 /LENGTH=279 /DNA_ID=CAMNT_0044494683 /DNA_START=242 /DNA_END=1081 /DNA_ORIENTATION=+
MATSKFAQVLAEKDFRALEDSLKTTHDGPISLQPPRQSKPGGLRKGLGTYLPAAFKFSEEEGDERNNMYRRRLNASSGSVVALDLALDSVWDNELKLLGDSTVPVCKKEKKGILLKKIMRERRKEGPLATNQLKTARTQDEAVEIILPVMQEMFGSVKKRVELTKVLIKCKGRRDEVSLSQYLPETLKGTEHEQCALAIEVTAGEEFVTLIRIRADKASTVDMQEMSYKISSALLATGPGGLLGGVDNCAPLSASPSDGSLCSLRDIKVSSASSYDIVM